MNTVIPYTPRKYQKYLHQNIKKKRWSVLVCHRRFGKTVMMINHLLMTALEAKEKTQDLLILLQPLNKQSLLLGII
jgi:hypothetical protein